MGVSGIIAAVFAIIALGLGVYVMSLVGENRELEDKLGATSKDLKKVSTQLDAQADKYQKKAQEASKKGSSAKGAKQRIAKLSDDLSASKAELNKAQGKVKEFSGNLNRLRIEREELRQELAISRKRLQELGSSAQELESLKTAAADAAAGAGDAEPAAPRPAPVADEASQGRKASLGRLERDLERSEEDRKGLVDRVRTLKRHLVHTTADLRTASRKLEANRRAYIITQLQLDLLTDENYVLKHGKQPPYQQAEKAQKRAALKPKVVTVVPDLESGVIDLPGAPPEPEWVPEPEMEEPAGVEDAEEAFAADDDADEAAAAEAAAEETAADDDAAAEGGEEIAAADEAPEPAAVEPEPEPEPEKRSVKLRKKAAAADVEEDGDVAVAAAAPPRPSSPPRPSAPPRPKA